MLGYLVTSVWGLAAREPRALIPVVGPFFLMAKLYRPGGIVDAGGVYFLLALAEAGTQIAGLIMLLAALDLPDRWLERDTAKPSVSFLPGAAGAPVGATLVGRF